MKAVLAVLSLLLLPGCLSIPARKMVEKWEDVAPGEVVVVGKIALEPKLEDCEQILTSGRWRRYRQMTVLVTNRRYRPFREPEGISFNGRVEARLEEPFFAAFPAEPVFYMGAFVFLETTRDSYRVKKAILPGGIKIDIRPSDKAVYIGTIRYFRDEFFEILGYEVEDDYEEANRLYRERFGPGAPLRKALLSRPAIEAPVETIASLP